jgi:hypothetical protein
VEFDSESILIKFDRVPEVTEEQDDVLRKKKLHEENLIAIEKAQRAKRFRDMQNKSGGEQVTKVLN